jgi:hypothetical protein
MTIATAWYDARAKRVREYEMHFKVARRGRIRNVRRQLARRGVPYFQKAIYDLYRRWIPKRKIRISFEREEPAPKVERTIAIEARRMEGVGKRWKAYPLPSRKLSYAKRRRNGRRK